MEIISSFGDYLKHKNLAVNTIISYQGSAKLYLGLYGQLSHPCLNLYREYLLRHYKPATVNQRIHGINHFSCFLTEVSKTSPALEFPPKIPAVKVQQRTFLDTIISNDDYQCLKNRLREDGQDFWYFIVRFLASTGSRVSELVHIKLEHIHVGYLDLYSKGGKIRRIYFPDSLCEEALAWCQSREISSGFLFLNRAGKLITARGIRYQLKHFAIKYGIDPDTVYPHSFRHRFAKNFLDRFHDIALLSDLMGHESIETTRIYLTKSSKEQKKLLDEIVTW